MGSAPTLGIEAATTSHPTHHRTGTGGIGERLRTGHRPGTDSLPETRRRNGERRDWDDWKHEDSAPPQASMAHILSGSCAGNKVAARNFMRELDKHAARATA